MGCINGITMITSYDTTYKYLFTIYISFSSNVSVPPVPPVKTSILVTCSFYSTTLRPTQSRVYISRSDRPPGCLCLHRHQRSFQHCQRTSGKDLPNLWNPAHYLKNFCIRNKPSTKTFSHIQIMLNSRHIIGNKICSSLFEDLQCL